MNRKIADAKQKLSEALAKLRRICEEEDYSLEVPPRENRPNPFADALDDSTR